LKEKPKYEIYFPPIYLHPLIEDGINLTHDCGWKQTFDVRKIKEHLKKEEKEAFIRKDTYDNVFILSCGKCGEK